MARDCKDFRNMMQHAMDDELDPVPRARLEAHLAGCEACRQEHDSLRISLAVLAAIEGPEPAPSFASETVRKARLAREAQVRRHRAFVWTMVASIAAASVATLGTWAGVLGPAIWEVVKWIPGVLSGLWSAAIASSTTLAAMSSVLAPLGGAAASMAWNGLVMFLPLYAIALAMMLFVTLISRTKRPVATLPLLSL
jgi:predicted anti-sigma-YlaC factor YlaD